MRALRFRASRWAWAVAVAALVAAAPAAGKTLHMHNGGDPASLDPHKVSGDWENRIVGDLFEGLVTEDRLASPIPGMALKWDISADGLTYTFHLRDAKWSDGKPVTAHDFVFALRRLMDPQTAANYAYLQYPIRNAEAVNSGEMPIAQLGVAALDERTLRIELENPTPYFLGALTHYTAYPVPRHVVVTHDRRAPGGVIRRAVPGVVLLCVQPQRAGVGRPSRARGVVDGGQSAGDYRQNPRQRRAAGVFLGAAGYGQLPRAGGGGVEGYALC